MVVRKCTQAESEGKNAVTTVELSEASALTPPAMTTWKVVLRSGVYLSHVLMLRPTGTFT
jgi:hypothetical protein